MSKIGKIIKELRVESQMSADKVAELLGKTGSNRRQFIYNIESGRVKRVDISTLKSLAAIFNVPISRLLSSPPESEQDQVDTNKQVLPESKDNDETWKQKYFKILEQNNKLQATVIRLMAEANEESKVSK